MLLYKHDIYTMYYILYFQDKGTKGPHRLFYLFQLKSMYKLNHDSNVCLPVTRVHSTTVQGKVPDCKPSCPPDDRCCSIWYGQNGLCCRAMFGYIVLNAPDILFSHNFCCKVPSHLSPICFNEKQLIQIYNGTTISSYLV